MLLKTPSRGGRSEATEHGVGFLIALVSGASPCWAGGKYYLIVLFFFMKIIPRAIIPMGNPIPPSAFDMSCDFDISYFVRDKLIPDNKSKIPKIKVM